MPGPVGVSLIRVGSIFRAFIFTWSYILDPVHVTVFVFFSCSCLKKKPIVFCVLLEKGRKRHLLNIKKTNDS